MRWKRRFPRNSERRKALAREIKRLEKLMMDHARNLEFEQAAAARDALTALKQRVLLDGAV